jgi:hypothetical protein
MRQNKSSGRVSHLPHRFKYGQIGPEWQLENASNEGFT